MKKLAVILLTLTLTVTPVFAQSTSTIHFNGSSTKVGSIIKDGTTYLGVRELGEATGLKVSYHPGNMSVLIEKGTDTLELLPVTAIYYFNNEDPATIEGIVKNDRVYVPLRFIFEKFGMKVDYKDHTIYITQ